MPGTTGEQSLRPGSGSALSVNHEIPVKSSTDLDARPQPSGNAPKVRYSAGLDGLRGLAVIMIVLYHDNQPLAKGGFLAVDLFFVISGFLITSLLLAEHGRNGQISLREFWARRLRRLLPAVLVLLVALCVWVAAWADPVARENFRGDAVSALTYLSNWRFISEGVSYFDQFSAPSPIRHLWSLAIEEQFYLLWPILAAGLLTWKRAGRKALCTLALVGAAASALAMAIRFDPYSPSRVYFGTDTHAFGLLLGAAAAFLPAKVREFVWLRRLALVATAGLALMMVFLHDTAAFTYQGGILLASIMAVPVVLATTNDAGTLRAFAWRPLVAVGSVSYGLYLWHWPVWTIFGEARVGADGVTLFAIRVSLMVAATLTSYWLIEQPIRKATELRGWQLVSLATPAIGTAVAAIIAVTTGPQVFTKAAEAARPDAKPQVTHAPPPKRPSLMIVGDSTGATATPGFETMANGYDVIPASFVPTDSSFCRLDLALDAVRDRFGKASPSGINPNCNWPELWPRAINAYRPRVVLMMFHVWDALPHRIKGEWFDPGTQKWNAHMTALTECAVSTLTADGASLLILSPPRLLMGTTAWTSSLRAIYKDIEARSNGKVVVVDYPEAVDRAALKYRWDGFHYNEAGAQALSEALQGAVKLAFAVTPPATGRSSVTTPACAAR